MVVYNLKGTADNQCRCGSWLQHWRNYSGTRTDSPTCCVNGCTKTATVGAHVQKASGSDKWWIIPVCHSHNMDTTRLAINEGTLLAPANKSETCG